MSRGPTIYVVFLDQSEWPYLPVTESSWTFPRLFPASTNISRAFSLPSLFAWPRTNHLILFKYMQSHKQPHRHSERLCGGCGGCCGDAVAALIPGDQQATSLTARQASPRNGSDLCKIVSARELTFVVSDGA